MPKTAICYYSATDSSERPFPDPESSEAITALADALKTKVFWDKFIASASLEGERESEGLSSELMKLYKSLFGLFQDEFMEYFRPHVERMSENVSEKSAQKAAAECLAGLLTGTRYWGFDQLTKMWDWVIPTLRKAFSVATPEVLSYWESFIKIVCVSTVINF